MVNDPVHQLQLYLRRAGNAVRSPSHEGRRINWSDEAARAHFFADGEEKVARLVAQIEGYTGATLESLTALDFGCGEGRLALPLAQRCAHVIGLDVAPEVLRQAEENAKRRNVSNVEWMDASRLSELGGRYDLVISVYVLQHIPSREGEQIFTTLVRGLRPGGVGAIHVTIRPSRALKAMFHWSANSARAAYNPMNLVRGLDWSYPYHLMHSYSLNRIGRLLAAEGITEWHARWHGITKEWRSYETATIFFRKR